MNAHTEWITIDIAYMIIIIIIILASPDIEYRMIRSHDVSRHFSMEERRRNTTGIQITIELALHWTNNVRLTHTVHGNIWWWYERLVWWGCDEG